MSEKRLTIITDGDKFDVQFDGDAQAWDALGMLYAAEAYIRLQFLNSIGMPGMVRAVVGEPVND